MEINRTIDGSRWVLTLSGDLDVHSTSAVEEALNEALDQATTVVLDISGVPFADSSGLGGLISAYKRAKADGKEIRLSRPTPIVSEILTITRMKRFFPVDE